MVASLVKDMTSSDPLNRANSIRVLSRIVTGGLLGNIEKYITQVSRSVTHSVQQLLLLSERVVVPPI